MKRKRGRENITFLIEGRRWRQSGRDGLHHSITHESNGSVLLQREKNKTTLYLCGASSEAGKVYVCMSVKYVCVWEYMLSVWNFKIDSVPLSRAKTKSLSCCLTTQCESQAVIQQCWEFTQVFFYRGVVLELGLICTLHHVTTQAENTGSCPGLCQDQNWSYTWFPCVST